MIYLDDFPYHTNKADYVDKPSTFASYARGITGKLLVVESGIEQQQFTIKLNVSQKESERLKTSFSKCHNTAVYLDYIDERDVFFDVASGSDSDNHKFSTGVWFASLGEPQPATEALFDPLTNTWFDPMKRFVVEIQLIINSTVLV